MMRRLLCCILVASASVVLAPSAMAEFGPSSFGVNPEFGFQQFSVSATNQDGTPDLQAGSHPYAFTTTFTMNLGHQAGNQQHLVSPADLKNLNVELPPGFVGDPNAVPKCSYHDFITLSCPNETVVGVATVFLIGDYILPKNVPVYNMEASPGVTAEFAFSVGGAVEVFLNVSVRTGGDYGLTARVNVTQAGGAYASKVTIWGVPAEMSHDRFRGGSGHGGCLAEERGEYFTPEEGEPIGVAKGLEGGQVRTGLGEGEDEQEEQQLTSTGNCPVNVPLRPLLTNPTSCGAPRAASISTDSWQEPEKYVSRSFMMPAITGCEKLDFSPSIEVTPDGTAGSTPTGLNVDVHVPQESITNPLGLGEADVKDTTVALPAGVQLSPSAADGLQACSEAQIGLHDAEKPSCPNASKIANVRVKTPLLEEELMGAAYLATPQNFAGPLENPFGSLFAMYLVIEDPARGVLVKLAGDVAPNPETGQLTSTFEDTPQLPFEDLRLEFYGSARAPLATPALCGRYTTKAVFAPWSGTSAVSPTSSFQITSGPNGSACSDPLPFTPSLTAGTTNIQAGAFSPFTMTMSREDGEQSLRTIQLHMPPGLLGILSTVRLCGEAEANAGTCGLESLVGETVVSAGLGNDPFSVAGGRVYITGPYEGAPFGLSIVSPAKAGPFVLQEGRPVVVRAKIEVNPNTATLTVTSGDVPTIIDGIPLQIKHVNVTISRSAFTFNPTSCDPMSITGGLNSAEGATSTLSVPFQVANCANLMFKPTFKVSTSSKTSRIGGASLSAMIAYPKAVFGSQANISRVKVELPKQLPSRLKTLQKACAATQFESNPAGCPPASIVGHAKAITPIIPVPLEGPAYFVSHGNEAYPSLIMVLQGYGVTIDVVGATAIKAGVTSSTFKTVPDAPVETFELTLPEGPYSALASDGNLCKSKLVMPTEFVAQNGAEIREDTRISVAGCSKATRRKTTTTKRKRKRERKK